MILDIFSESLSSHIKSENYNADYNSKDLITFCKCKAYHGRARGAGMDSYMCIYLGDVYMRHSKERGRLEWHSLLIRSVDYETFKT